MSATTVASRPTLDDKGRTRIGSVPDSEVTLGYIQAIDLESGVIETLYEEVDGRHLSAPNDIVFDAKCGGFWFTDHGKTWERHRDHGGIYYAQPDGSSIEEVIYPVEAPNGIGLSPDEESVVLRGDAHGASAGGRSGLAPAQLASEYGKSTRGRVLGWSGGGATCSTRWQSIRLATSVWRRSAMAA